MTEWFAEAGNAGTGPVSQAVVNLGLSNYDINRANSALAQYNAGNQALFARFRSPLA